MNKNTPVLYKLSPCKHMNLSAENMGPQSETPKDFISYLEQSIPRHCNPYKQAVYSIYAGALLHIGTKLTCLF